MRSKQRDSFASRWSKPLHERLIFDHGWRFDGQRVVRICADESGQTQRLIIVIPDQTAVLGFPLHAAFVACEHEV